MSTSRRTNCVALWAQRGTIKQFQQLHEINIFVDDIARIGCHQDNVEGKSNTVQRNSPKSIQDWLSTVQLQCFLDLYHEEKDIEGNDCGFVFLNFLNWGGTSDDMAS